MSEPNKHHYLPVFYLKAWASFNGKLCEYSRPYAKVVAKWKHPAATGYQPGLYTLPGVAPEHAQQIEKYWMGLVDTEAAKAHKVILSHGTPDSRLLTPSESVAWARFLYALTFRNPERVKDINRRYAEHAPGAAETLKEEYERRRSATDSKSFEEFKEDFFANPTNTSGLNVIPRLLRSSSIIGPIAKMQSWSIKLQQKTGPTFLTSDRPIIMTNGLSKSDAHIVLPVSPDILYVAGRDTQAYDFLADLDGPPLVKLVNEFVTSQAERYVYGKDASRVPFVTKRLGKKLRSTPLG